MLFIKIPILLASIPLVLHALAVLIHYPLQIFGYILQGVFWLLTPFGFSPELAIVFLITLGTVMIASIVLWVIDFMKA